MKKHVIVLSLLGWCLRQTYGHQPIHTGYDLDKEYVSAADKEYVSAARERPSNKLPSQPTYTPGYQAQDGRTVAYNSMAPGIRMTTTEKDLKNELNVNVMPNTIQTTTSVAATARLNKNEKDLNYELNMTVMPDVVQTTNSTATPARLNKNEKDLKNERNVTVMPNTVQTTPSAATPARFKNTGLGKEENKRIIGHSTNSHKLDDPYHSEEYENKLLRKEENHTQDSGSENNNSRTEGHSHHSEIYTKEEQLFTASSLQTTRGFEDNTDSVRGYHRTSRRNDLCSACLCNPEKKNVFCKHEHVYDGRSHHLTLKREHIPPNATSLHIMDFEAVTITDGAFHSEDLELRTIKFENIGMLELYKESLYFNSKAKDNRKVEVVFSRCNIREIPPKTFTQYSRSDERRNVLYLEKTRSLSLHIERCNITAIRSYALFQARLLNFKMVHTKVDIMEENCINLDVYKEWIVKYSQLPNLGQQAISLRTQMLVMFSHNIMGGLENRSLDILSSNQVLFENNYVSYLGSEALLGIRPYGNARGANIVFLNNTVAKAEERSLVTSISYPSHERKVLDNAFKIVCTCNIKLTFQHLLGISNKSDDYDQATYQEVIEKFQCQRFEGLAIYKYVEDYYNENCTPIPIPIIASVSTVITVIIITIIVCVVCTRRAEKAKEEANYLGECCYSHSFSTLHSNPGQLKTPYDDQGYSSECVNYLQPWVVAVPEVKTYKETEVHVHYEHTQPINVSMREKDQPESPIDFHRVAKVRASYPFN